jgi:hypothetical protein
MDEFPSELIPSNVHEFEHLRSTEHLRILRKELYSHIIKGDESDFYDIDAFNRKYVQNNGTTKKMINLIIEELQSMGWKTFLGFGDTGLYVFAGEKPLNAY